MRFELFISLRYLLARHKRKFISITTIISVLGIAVGVAALIVVISVMSGFGNELMEKIVGTNAHILIETRGGIEDPDVVMERLQGIEHIVAASPFINGEAILRSEDFATGVLLRGIDPSREDKVTRIGQHLVMGSLDLKEDGIAIGTELSRKLAAFLGDGLSVVTAASRRPGRLKVSAIFNTGMYEYDERLAFVSLKKAQELYGVGRVVGGIGVKLDDPGYAKISTDLIQRALGYNFRVMSWMDLNRNLFSAVRLEKILIFIIVTLTVVVAALNIISCLSMAVMEKTKDIGILSSIGATTRSIVAIFLLEGATIGVVGTFLGTTGGLLLARSLNPIANFITRLTGFEIFPKDIYYFDKIPTNINLTDVVLIVFCAIAISLLASFYPAWQASRLDPVEALRYE